MRDKVHHAVYNIPLRATATSQLCCKGIKARPDGFQDLNIAFKAAFTRDRIHLESVRIGLVFTRDLVDSVRIGSGYLVPDGSTYKGDPVWNRTVPI